MQALGWGSPAERFAWAAVELGGNAVEVLVGVDAMAERWSLTTGRSPSQWPGMARSSASAGRSLIITMGWVNRCWRRCAWR
jgi:hypothetical protein